jgi:hypothetical protein
MKILVVVAMVLGDDIDEMADMISSATYPVHIASMVTD